MRLPIARLSSALVIGVCVTRVVAADSTTDESSSSAPPHNYVCPSALLHGCGCCYCPKPMPCIKPYCPQCCCDDYCCKPIPCVHCFCGPWRCDSYCPKPMPCVCRPLAADFYTCDTGSACNRCSNRSSTESSDVEPTPTSVNSPDQSTEPIPNLLPPSDPR